MTKPDTLPIFPLPLVTCPDEPKLLHIFEERYRELTRHARIKQKAGAFNAFGIVYSGKGTPSDHIGTVGCAVVIESVLKEHDDGRSDILVRGHDRFVIKDVLKDVEAYDLAEVEWIDDEQPDDWDETLASETYQLHRMLNKLVLGDYPADEIYTGKSCLSFAVAPSSGLESHQLYRLLTCRAENERLTQLIEHFHDVVPVLQRAESIRSAIHDIWNIQHFIKQDDIPE